MNRLTGRQIAEHKLRAEEDHLYHLVVDGGVKNSWYEACTDALDLVGTTCTAGQHGALGGLNGDDLDFGVLLTEVLSSARDGSAGAHARNENIDLQQYRCPLRGSSLDTI